MPDGAYIRGHAWPLAWELTLHEVGRCHLLQAVHGVEGAHGARQPWEARQRRQPWHGATRQPGEHACTANMETFVSTIKKFVCCSRKTLAKLAVSY